MSQKVVTIACPKHPKHNLDTYININPHQQGRRFKCPMCHKEALKLGHNHEDLQSCIELMEESTVFFQSPHYKDAFFTVYLEQYDSLLGKDVDKVQLVMKQIINNAKTEIHNDLEALRQIISPYTQKFDALKKSISEFKFRLNDQLGYDQLKQSYEKIKTQNLNTDSEDWSKLEKQLESFIKSISPNNNMELRTLPESLVKQYDELQNFSLNTQSYYSKMVRTTRELQIQIGNCFQKNFSLQSEIFINEADSKNLELRVDQFTKQSQSISKTEQVQLIQDTFEKQQRQIVELKQIIALQNEKSQTLGSELKANESTVTLFQNELRAPIERLEIQSKELNTLREETKQYNTSTINLIESQLKPNIQQIQVQCQEIKQLKEETKNQYDATMNLMKTLQAQIDQFQPHLNFKSNLCPPEFYEVIQSQLQYRLFKIQLIYKLGTDAKTANALWGKINGKMNTLLLFKTDTAKVVGAYTPVTWNSALTNYVKDDSLTSFLFSVTDNKIYRLKVEKKDQATYHNATLLQSFGDGHDLCIKSDFTVTSSLNSAYDASAIGDINASTYLLGADVANITEMEVYQIFLR